MRLKIVLLIIALMISVQAVAGSSSIGVGASPGNLSFKLAPGTSSEQSMYVINTGNETATYGIFVDGNTYDDWFTFSSTSFDLQAGENREVKVTLNVPATAETDVESKIKISCTASGKAVGTGVIMPVYIEISPSEVSNSDSDASDESKVSHAASGKAGVKEISQKLVDNASSLMTNSTQEIMSTGESLKASAEGLEEAANTSLNNATASLGEVTRKFDDTSRKIEDTKKRFEDLNLIYEGVIQYFDNVVKTYVTKIFS